MRRCQLPPAQEVSNEETDQLGRGESPLVRRGLKCPCLPAWQQQSKLDHAWAEPTKLRWSPEFLDPVRIHFQSVTRHRSRFLVHLILPFRILRLIGPSGFSSPRVAYPSSGSQQPSFPSTSKAIMTPMRTPARSTTKRPSGQAISRPPSSGGWCLGPISRVHVVLHNHHAYECVLGNEQGEASVSRHGLRRGCLYRPRPIGAFLRRQRIQLH